MYVLLVMDGSASWIVNNVLRRSLAAAWPERAIRIAGLPELAVRVALSVDGRVVGGRVEAEVAVRDDEVRLVASYEDPNIRNLVTPDWGTIDANYRKVLAMTEAVLRRLGATPDQIDRARFLRERSSA